MLLYLILLTKVATYLNKHDYIPTGGNVGRLDRFLRTFSSTSTVRSYRSTLRRYFGTFYPGVDLEKAVETYFDDDRNYQHDIQDFLGVIKDEAPNSVKTRLSIVRTFLVENEVEVPEGFWRRLRRRVKGSRARTIDYIPTTDELRRIISHMPIQGQALFLTQLSSGMRIGEVLSLKVMDVDLSTTPTTIQIRGSDTKTGNQRTSYVSSEATEALEGWQRLRPKYLKNSKRSKSKKEQDERVFPFLRRTAYVIWNGAVEKTGLLHKQKDTNRYTLHPHCLRKWYRTRMATLIPVDIVEALMGHEGYLTAAYRRYSPEDLAAFYRKGEQALLIHQPINLEEVKEEVDERIHAVVNGLTAENMELKKKVSGLKEENTSLRSEFSELQDNWASFKENLQAFYEAVQIERKKEKKELKKLKAKLASKN